EIEKLEHLPDVKSISAGNRHLCALTYKNEIYCSGSNTHGQLGNPIIPESIHALDVLVMAVPVRGL
ncbi:MAG: RCC1 domain-containing protein, partial [Myxococcota bacterium]|nr:RCC1 domain-containing protein [Myxococcota bacterium]